MDATDNLPDRSEPQATAGVGNIQRLLELGQARLADSPSARLDAQLLLAHVLQRPRSHLATYPERPVSPLETAAYRALLARAVAGEPLAYLLGTREFWSLPLSVTPAVLIPRPETELAVERCLALLDLRSAVCDLGTGSGAIALALAVEHTALRITATDRSTAAVRIARANAARLGVHNVEFLEGDWFEPLIGRRFAVIVSNPPYVRATDPALAALTHEPLEALTPGPSGFEALRAIISQAPAHLMPGGWLVLEHGADQGAEVARTLVATGYARVGCHRDLAGFERVTEAQWL